MLKRGEPIGCRLQRRGGGRPRLAVAGVRNAEHRVQERAQVRLVDRAGVRHEVAQVPHRPLAEAREALGRPRLLPSSIRGDPARGGEVVERQQRHEPVLVARVEHAPVVIERRPRELALLGLDPRPLDREAVGAEPERRDRRDVLGVAVVVVAGIARPLAVVRPGHVLEQPAVVVDVASLDLVGRGGGTPEEAVGEAHVILPPSRHGDHARGRIRARRQ